MNQRVLIADDSEDMRVLLGIVFADAGYDVVASAVDGLDAVAAWERVSDAGVDVVVLDNRMPGLNGVDVAARIKGDAPSQRVVIFSAFLDDETRARAREVGVDLLLSKDDALSLPARLAT